MESPQTGEVTPTISVLLPVRNAVATLAACLRSVSRQTLTDWECVLVDDGSTDGSPRSARLLLGHDPRLRVVERPPQGIVGALTHGLSLCRGRYVARMDADDAMHRDRLRLQVAALDAAPEIVGVGCHVRLFPRSSLGPGYREYERWLNSMRTAEDIRRESWIECPLAHPSMTLRRETLTSFGWRDRGWPEDYDLVLRLLNAGQRLDVVPRRLLAWRNGRARLSRTDPTYADDRFTACKAAFLATSFLARRERYILWGYGGTGRRLRRALAEHGRFPSQIVERHPGRLGNRIHGAPVIEPAALRDVPRRPLVVSVAGADARGQIRAALAELGYRETRDYVCAA